MDLNEEDESVNENGRLFLVTDAPRDPLVSAGAIVASAASVPDDINQGDDLQSSALASLIGSAQSTSVCFPTKFSKCITTLCVLCQPGPDLINCRRPLEVGVVLLNQVIAKCIKWIIHTAHFSS